ncbi:uracil-DNA glycosylase [Desulfurococcaceae archaeon AG1]|jgi:uracil-DNA glycosylase family 4|nr:uracil-DNA glycosylase [Desulfurococcaceae archaeon AG1]
MDPNSPLGKLAEEVISCSLCPRLARYRVEASLKDPGRVYWAKPVPGYGDPMARIFVVGLAPAVRGGNRTGRVFTGDETSQNLMRALYEVGLSNQPYSISADDGLVLRDVYLTAAVKCAPPDNRPNAQEIATCNRYLEAEVKLLKRSRVFVALGNIAWSAMLKAIESALGAYLQDLDLGFRHGAIYSVETRLRGAVWLISSYHPSPRNMRTGRLTHEMLVTIFRRAVDLANTDQNTTAHATR